ncbi:MAG: hypothetical protein AB1758_33680 [Candidatus Eremiobacterota bacterium]
MDRGLVEEACTELGVLEAGVPEDASEIRAAVQEAREWFTRSLTRMDAGFFEEAARFYGRGEICFFEARRMARVSGL